MKGLESLLKELKNQKILVHLGYHKTASTWLQNELFISANEVFEPFSTRDKAHSTLGELFFQNKEGYLLSPFSEHVELDEILRVYERKKSSDKILTISHERLSGNPQASAFDAPIIAKRLHNTFPNARILILIRNQVDLITSCYFQYLSKGGTKSIKKYLNDSYDMRMPYFSPDHFDFTDLVATYQRFFGQNNVLVYPFELFKKNPDNFVSQLSRFIGREIDFNKSRFVEIRNQKKAKFLTYYLRFLNLLAYRSSMNGYSPFYHPLLAWLIIKAFKVMGWLSPNFLEEYITKKVRGQVKFFVGNRYQSSNEKLSKLIGLNLQELNY
ncbi:sulfotransferase domain-containing protein [Ekhidna sp.]|uniref:sulfotransferase domain-containing protein n=1 Tax=Ekhidna sp. TaxID=2608089 RepID=UPI003B5BDAF1